MGPIYWDIKVDAKMLLVILLSGFSHKALFGGWKYMMTPVPFDPEKTHWVYIGFL